MKKLFILFLLASCAHHKKATDSEINQYCKDLNVLYQKRSVIDMNIANINTTRTPEGGYYKRQVIKECHDGFCTIEKDPREPLMKYEPKAPDANKSGYVAYPHMNLAEEHAELRQWENVYRNVTKFAPVKNDFFLKDKRAQDCFMKYPFVDEKHNYRKYIGR